jgi:hypothetical protein
MNFFSSRTPKGQVLGLWWSNLVILNPKSAEATTHTDITHESIVLNMRKCLMELKSEYMSEDGTSVDYEGIGSSSRFQEYVKITGNLHDLDLTRLSVVERKSFFINVYNSLVIHAMVDGFVKPGDRFTQRLKMYATASYTIGGHHFSLNDMEHGVLRGNLRPPTPLSSTPFAPDDPRVAVSVILDPRIHFALNCGARSCPPISVYKADKLDLQLTRAVQGTLRHVIVSPEEEKVTVSMLFKWYREDFGASDGDVLDWVQSNGPQEVAQALISLRSSSSAKGGHVTIDYHPYDWDINS